MRKWGAFAPASGEDMKKFEVGQEYLITSNARPMGIGKVCNITPRAVTFDLSRPGGKQTRFAGVIRELHGTASCQVIVPRDYDAVYAGTNIHRSMYGKETEI